MQTGIIQKVQSKYVCHRPTAEYDSVTFVVNHEVAASDHIQVKPDVAQYRRINPLFFVGR